MKEVEKMSQNKMSIYYFIILGFSLFLTLFLIGQSEGYVIFIYAGLFFIFNIIKDAIFFNLGFIFKRFSFKRIIVINILGLIVIIIWYFCNNI